MQLHAHIADGKIVFSPQMEALKAQWARKLRPGTEITITLKQYGRNKTHQQCKAFFGIVVTIAQEALREAGCEVMGVPLNKEQVKEVLYHYCSPLDENGKKVRISVASVTQMMELYDNCDRWLLQTFGCVLPAPDPRWREQEKSK